MGNEITKLSLQRYRATYLGLVKRRFLQSSHQKNLPFARNSGQGLPESRHSVRITHFYTSYHDAYDDAHPSAPCNPCLLLYQCCHKRDSRATPEIGIFSLIRSLKSNITRTWPGQSRSCVLRLHVGELIKLCTQSSRGLRLLLTRHYSSRDDRRIFSLFQPTV